MRYFFFSYNVQNDKKVGRGNIGIMKETFPSDDELREIAAERNPEMTSDNIIITGWNEFKSEEDYYSFFGKE